MATYRIKLARTDSNAEKHFTLDLDSRMTVLDALFIIQREHDPSLSFRCSCRVGMCGTCAMRINWMPRLACQTRVETLNAGAITIEPLANLPVSKDLVVDLGPFFAKWKKIRPALHPKNKDSKDVKAKEAKTMSSNLDDQYLGGDCWEHIIDYQVSIIFFNRLIRPLC